MGAIFAFAFALCSFIMGTGWILRGIHGTYLWGLGPYQFTVLGYFLLGLAVIFIALGAFFGNRSWHFAHGKSPPSACPDPDIEDGSTIKQLRKRANIMMWSVGLAASAIYVMRWGTESWPEFAGSRSILYTCGLVIAGYIVGTLTNSLWHEGIHGLGMWLGGTPSHCIVLGIHPSRTHLFADTNDNHTVRAHIFWLMLPALLLGVLPLAIGLLSGVPFLVAFGVSVFYGSSIDLADIWMLRKIPWNTTLHLDGEASTMDSE